MSGHTPAPWIVKENGTMVCVYAGGFNVAAIGSKNCPEDNAPANARLIAAAPDLLAACQTILADCWMNHDETEMVKAAIAKAGGDTIPPPK